MKKRLFRNLLMLGLLLVALTVMASAFTVEVNGKKVKTTLVIEYSCGICKTRPMLDDEDYTINSFQAYTADGTPKPLAEWKYNDGLVLSVTIKNTSCSKCRTNGVNTPIQGGTFNVVIDAAHVGYYCHKQFAFIKVEGGDFDSAFLPSIIFLPQSTMRKAPTLMKKMATTRSAGSAPAAASVLMQSIQPRQT